MVFVWVKSGEVVGMAVVADSAVEQQDEGVVVSLACSVAELEDEWEVVGSASEGQVLEVVASEVLVQAASGQGHYDPV